MGPEIHDLVRGLSRPEARELANLRVQRGGRPAPFESVLAAWAQDAAVYRGQLDSSLADNVWNADDWIGSLLGRDRIADSLPLLSPPLRKHVDAWLAAVDAYVIDYTAAHRDLVAARAQQMGDTPRDEWWWTRAPSRGPVLDDLLGL